MNAIEAECWGYLKVCIPVVVVFAPVGSFLGSHFHRLVLAGLVIFLDSVTLVLAYILVRPLNAPLVGASVGLITGFFLVFLALSGAGEKLLVRIEQKEKKKKNSMGKVQNGSVSDELLDPDRVDECGVEPVTSAVANVSV